MGRSVRGWKRLVQSGFGLNGSHSKSSACSHQGFLHSLCAQTMLMALVTIILRKYFVCVKMLILYWGLNIVQIPPTITNNST